MTVHINIILVVFLSVVLATPGLAQVDSAYVSAVNNHIQFVDMLTDTANANKVNAIISSKYFVNQFDTNNLYIKKGFLIFKTLQFKGTYSIWTTYEASNSALLKVEVHFYTKNDIAKTFYYDKNKLVFAEITLREKGNHAKIIYAEREFYKDDKLIIKETPINNALVTDEPDIEINLQKGGQIQLKTFLDRQKSYCSRLKETVFK